jgi:hypothetical protein
VLQQTEEIKRIVGAYECFKLIDDKISGKLQIIQQPASFLTFTRNRIAHQLPLSQPC